MSPGRAEREVMWALTVVGIVLMIGAVGLAVIYLVVLVSQM